MTEEQNFSKFISALSFACKKHSTQRRKDEESTPYINHPVKVAEILWNTGKVRDMDVIIGGLLHDTVEDTETKIEEIKELFGEKVALYVSEVTDDKNLPKLERKRMQVEKSPYKSNEAKQIKVADKISNISDIINSPPQKWAIERKFEYIEWTKNVVDGIRGCNHDLEKLYDETYEYVKKTLENNRGN